MKRVLTIFLFLITGCATMMVEPLTEEQKEYQQILEITGTQAELYASSKEWILTNLTGSHQVAMTRGLLDEGVLYDTGLLNSNDESFTLIANGYVEIVSFPVLNIKYNCKIQVKENRVRITYYDFNYFFDAGVDIRTWAELQPQMLNKLHPELDALNEDLKTKLSKNLNDSEW
tara:strand:- start:212 stop:730 length:519 start_codon:yes stop_codon:yes gene_type:complete